MVMNINSNPTFELYKWNFQESDNEIEQLKVITTEAMKEQEKEEAAMTSKQLKDEEVNIHNQLLL